VPRAIVIGFSFALTLGVIIAAAASQFGEVAYAIGARLFYPQQLLEADLAKVPSGSAPLVAWLGDSTILSGPDIVAYPQLIPQVRSWPVRVDGLNPFGYYLFLEPILEQQPKLVAIVANARLLNGTVARDMTTAAHLIPPRELPAALLLPWYAQGTSLPRLLLNRTLAWKPVEDFAAVLDGLRRLYQEAAFWQALDLIPEAKSVGLRRFFFGTGRMLEAYDTPVSPRTPSVQMMDACIQRIRAAGAEALVIVTPIPAAVLQTYAWYDPKRNASRMKTLRKHWESKGAHVVDLHNFLTQDLFRDYSGHPTQRGHETLAERLRHEVDRITRPPDPNVAS
jgi:hypothetical protein